jgi:hypothetical protein
LFGVPEAPFGVTYFTLATKLGNSPDEEELMTLTSLTASAVPEPSSYAAVLAAFGLLFVVFRRKFFQTA